MRNWLAALAAIPLLLAASNNAQADFSGAYDPGNWVKTISDTGSINTSGAPTSVTFTGGSSGSGNPSSQIMQITIPVTGTLSFDWQYVTYDISGPTYDPFGYILNGTPYQLTSNNGTATQSGGMSLPLTSGNIFAFDQYSTDSIGGAGVTTISNFSGPAGAQGPGTNVPEPATLALLGLSLLGLAASRKVR